MAYHLTVLAVLLPMILGIAMGADNSVVNTESLVLKHDYPIEAHTVTTSDGYILTIHRIPYSPRTPIAGPRPVVFIQHGLLCSSSDWVIGGLENGLAFILSDAGFDVWLGNARGNTYSRRHVTLNPSSNKFWNFSWHEIGTIDLPAMIDYVRQQTGVAKLVYIGHSQGTTAFFVLNSIYPEYNQYFESAHMLSPVAYMKHLTAPLVTLVAPLLGNSLVSLPLDLLGNGQFNPSKSLMQILGSLLCNNKRPNYVLCSNALFLAAGFDNDTVAYDIVDDVMKTTPAGASTGQFLHYMQEFTSGRFCQYDHGPLKNMAKYGRISPPDYPIANINSPLFLYYSDSDTLVAVKDVERLIPQLNSLVVAYRIPEKKFDHLGQMYNPNIRAHVYDLLLKNIFAYAQK